MTFQEEAVLASAYREDSGEVSQSGKEAVMAITLIVAATVVVTLVVAGVVVWLWVLKNFRIG